jgi:hypothetical protein
MGLINVGHIIKQIKNIVWNESQRRSQDFGRVQQNLDGAGFTYYRINFLMGAKYYQGVGRANWRLPCLRL